MVIESHINVNLVIMDNLIAFKMENVLNGNKLLAFKIKNVLNGNNLLVCKQAKLHAGCECRCKHIQPLLSSPVAHALVFQRGKRADASMEEVAVRRK